MYLLQLSVNTTKKELDFKACKKVLRELSILLCFDLESCFKIIEKKYYKKKLVSFIDFKECLLNFVNNKEAKLNNDFIKEQKNPFNFEYDFLPTNDDMVNNKENILNCINSTNDINLILIHRSLYIIQKKFEQNKEKLKEVYNKYGEYFEKDENILIDQNYLSLIIKQIFNINRFEISDVASFREALFKEMDYCKDINIEQYILNEFIEFIKKNRKKYNFILREKRNNSNFNLDDYININFKIIDDWSKEGQINLFEDEYEQNDFELILNNIKNRKICSAKFHNKMQELNIKNNNDLKINLNLIKEKIEGINNENENSYSESSAMISGRRELSNRGKELGINYGNESSKGIHISNNNTKRKEEEENEKKSIIQENDTDEEEEKDEKEINNKPKEEINKNKDLKTEENEDNVEENEEEEENDEIEDSENTNKKQDNDKLDDIDLVKIDKGSNINDKKIIKKKDLLFGKHLDKDNLQNNYCLTKYKRDNKDIKTIKYKKYYIYADIIPLIIADFISDQRNLYVVIDRSDDLRNNLTTIFDSEILYKLGQSNIEEVINQMLIKIAEYKKTKNKVEKNIDNFENLFQKMKNKNQDTTYIEITLQKLKDFLNWLNSKLFSMKNDIKEYQEFERKKKEEQERIFGANNLQKFAKDKLKEKKDKLIEDYKQLKRDIEIRKFMIQKRKRFKNINKSKNKINLKPIITSTILNNSNNISNIEKDNSNNLSINSNELTGDEYKNTFVLSEQNLNNFLHVR